MARNRRWPIIRCLGNNPYYGAIKARKIALRAFYALILTNINYKNQSKAEILGNISVYLKSASSKQTVEMNKYENRTLIFTFSDLSKVLGISYYAQSGDNSIMTKSISISGNVVSVTVYNGSSSNTALTCKSSVTVIGY